MVDISQAVLEKSPCGAEGEEKARFSEFRRSLSISIIPRLVSRIKARGIKIYATRPDRPFYGHETPLRATLEDSKYCQCL